MLSFKRLDPNKITEKDRIQKEAQQVHDEAIGHAQDCLGNEDFRKYKESYELAEKLVIKELIELDILETDPTRYGFRCKDIVAKLRHLGTLLRQVESDAGKKL